MFDFHEKRKIRRVLYSKTFIAFLFLVAFFIGTSVYERFAIEREMNAKLQARAHELEALKQRAALLESKVEHMKNERGIEEELRNRFDVAKEGEQVVIILDEEEDLSEKNRATSSLPHQQQRQSFFEMLRFW